MTATQITYLVVIFFTVAIIFFVIVWLLMWRTAQTRLEQISARDDALLTKDLNQRKQKTNMHSSTELVSKLLTEIESDLGTEEMSHLFISALYTAMDQLESDNLDSFRVQLRCFIRMINDLKPKYARLLDICYRLWDEIELVESHGGARTKLFEALDGIKDRINNNFNKLIAYGSTIIEGDDKILLFTRSVSVLQALVVAKKRGKKFTVLLAEQDKIKTKAILAVLEKARIPFSTVPSYMLSHMIDDIDKVFLGSITYVSSHDFVADAGTAGVVALAKSHDIPIYMFMATSKFSLWKATSAEVALRTVVKQTGSINRTYEQYKFSHDRMNIKNFESIVTEKGIYSLKRLEKYYNQRVEENSKKRYGVLK